MLAGFLASKQRGLLCLTAMISLACEPSSAGDLELTLRTKTEQAPAAFVLTGMVINPDAVAKEFSVTVASAGVGLKSPPPLIGRHVVTDKRIEFIPRFPLSPGVQYQVHLSERLRAELTGYAAKEPLLFSTGRAKSEPTAMVSQVFPTADQLPENLLKFYIHFSEPMNRGEAYSRIHLLHEGQGIDQPFLELGEELWDRDQSRFTLFIHPGRIKRGVKPREENGPAIEAGKAYTLRIDGEWTAAGGLHLKEAFEKRFQVAAPDHQQPNLEQWKIETPGKETKDPIILNFNEPLDHAMLTRVLHVKDLAGKRVPGKVQVSDGETRWEFSPESEWPPGIYTIEVAANLEDLCGNSIARPFEVQMQDGGTVKASAKVAIELVIE